MSRLTATLALLLLTTLTHAAGTKVELDSVDRLGRINGDVLACGYLELVPRVKGAMILYVRETREMGKTFEDATQARYRELVGGKAECAPRGAVLQEIDAAVEGIKQAFPLNID